MKILITGTSKGIGKAIAEKFINEDHFVIGFDILAATINNPNYKHYVIDVRNKDSFPEIDGLNIIINNAGVQTNTVEDINVNLIGTINITEKYAFQENIKSVLNIASPSGVNGSEFPYYASSKGGVIAYTKNTALTIAKFGATCNALSPGGVITSSNNHILNDKKLYQQVLNETLLNKWMDTEEIAEFAYFMTVINKSMTGENIIVDNGELLKSNFIW